MCSLHSCFWQVINNSLLSYLTKMNARVLNKAQLSFDINHHLYYQKEAEALDLMVTRAGDGYA